MARRALGVWLLAMVGAGLALAGIQLLPLIELAQRNFRQGSVSYADVVGWAWPKRQVLTFFLPDVFGNPSHHGYWDIWARRWVPATVNALGEPIRTIFWGVKNYVEGGNYLGLLTMALAALGVGVGLRQRPTRGPVAFFAILSLIALANAFGTPLYALFYYGLPWYKQVHSPFRWVFPLTLAMATLAAMPRSTLPASAEERNQARRAVGPDQKPRAKRAKARAARHPVVSSPTSEGASLSPMIRSAPVSLEPAPTSPGRRFPRSRRSYEFVTLTGWLAPGKRSAVRARPASAVAA